MRRVAKTIECRVGFRTQTYPRLAKERWAVELAEKAVRLSGNQRARAFATLAAAFAEINGFSAAIEAAQRASAAGPNRWRRRAGRRHRAADAPLPPRTPHRESVASLPTGHVPLQAAERMLSLGLFHLPASRTGPSSVGSDKEGTEKVAQKAAQQAHVLARGDSHEKRPAQKSPGFARGRAISRDPAKPGHGPHRTRRRPRNRREMMPFQKRPTQNPTHFVPSRPGS